MLRTARARCTQQTGHEEPLPGRRRGAQLRGQRPDPARGPVRRHLDPAGGGRRRRRARRGAVHLAPAARQRRGPSAAGRPQSGSLLGPAFGDDEIETFLDARGRDVPADRRRRRAAATTVADAHRRRARSSAGSRGGWSSARARSARAASSATRASPTMQSRHEPEDQVPRVVPAVRARACCASTRTSTSRCGRSEESPYMLLVAPVRDDKRLRSAAPSWRTPRGSTSSGSKRSVDPGRHPRRLLGARPDRRSRAARPATASCSRRFHRKTGCPVHHQHQLQRARGADRLHAARGLRDVHVGRHRHAVHGPLRAREGSAAGLGRERRCAALASQRGGRSPRAPEAAGATRSSTHSSRARAAARSCRAVARAGPVPAAGASSRATDGIAQLFWPHEKFADARDVTEKVQAFYEETPFPNYEDHDSLRSLIDKSRRGVYARRLDATIPVQQHGPRGGVRHRAADELPRHRLPPGGRHGPVPARRCGSGEEFRRKHDLDRVRFVQMNLFRPAFRPGTFDVVLCNGVLHHTADPFGGLERLVPLAQAGGPLRDRALQPLRTSVHRPAAAALQGDRAGRGGAGSIPFCASCRAARRSGAPGSPTSTGTRTSRSTRSARCSAGSSAAGSSFVRGIPSTTAEPEGLEGADLFEPRPPGSGFDHFLVQARQIFAGQREGGFFLLIGRRSAEPHEGAGRAAVGRGGG